MQPTSPPPQTPTVQRPDAFDDSDSDDSQVTLQRRSPLPPRAVKSPSATEPQPQNYSRPALHRDDYAAQTQSSIGAALGHRPRQRSQGYFEPSLPSNLASMSNANHLDASRIAAQTAMQNPQHMRKRSTTIPEPGSQGPMGRQPSSPPPMPGQHTVTFKTNGMTYSNGVVGGNRMAATAAANVAFPRSPLASPNLQQAQEHASPKPGTPEPPKTKEKSKMKLFSKPKNIKIDKGRELDSKFQALPSPGKMGIGIHSSQALNRMMMNQSTTSLAESSIASNASLYSSANGSTSTLVPRNDGGYLPQEKDKHKHHFLSRQKQKLKDNDAHSLPLSSASSTSRPVDPSAPQSLYSFTAPASPGHSSTFGASVTGLDLRHGGRHLRRAKKEEKAAAYLDAQFDVSRDRKQSFSTDRSEWPSMAGTVTPMSNLGPSPGAALSNASDVLNLGTSFGINGMSPDDAWPLLKARVLLIFEGEDPRPPVEDFNALVTVHVKRCIQKRSPIILIEDLNELLMTGFGSLDQTLRHVPDDRLIPHLVEMWIVVFTTILPFLQAVFLPLDLEFRGSGIMSSTAAADFWGVLLPDEMNTKSPENKNIPILGELDVRRITLLMFRDIVILPRYDTLMAIFSRLSLENLNAGLESPSPIPDARPSTAGSAQDMLPLGSLNSTSQGSSGGYLESTTSMTSSTFASSSRSRATSNTSAGSFSAHSIHSNPSTLLQPTTTTTSLPPSLRNAPMDSAKVTETVGRMLQCVSVLVSLQSGDEAQDKMGRLNKELKYNWLGRGRTGRQRQGFVGARRGGGMNFAAVAEMGGAGVVGVGA
ncbi:HbrB-like protein [Lentithecium fluviatile CBS 122367]|uniref:HbrB-like protein n=1 Tax=Lentithecium fluviatile CBS 122367 TaxID=1168545 RepID=A0A6G1JHU5_9PLEO|nr:HbrB-like protein [Lentithecium fluviatile CBS 122367]